MTTSMKLELKECGQQELPVAPIVKHADNILLSAVLLQSACQIY
jgi:hypothetical protein